MSVMSGMSGRIGLLLAQAVHTCTHTHINEYTVYSVSISLMSDIIFNIKSRHHVLVSF